MSIPQLTYATLPEVAESIRRRAARIALRQYARANAAAERAGVGHARNVWTNAQISADAGRPWAEVNYAQLRQAEYHDRIRAVAYHLADRIISRLIARLEGRTVNYPELPTVSWERPYRSGRIDAR